MTYIITNADRNIMRMTSGGKTGAEIIRTAGDGLKTGSLPSPVVSYTDTPTRMEHFKRYGDSAPHGMVKTALEVASQSFSTSQIMQTNPSFYSPIHTPINWNIPSKRREVYLWCVTPNTEITVLRNGFIEEIPIRQVKVSDFVLTHKGNFKKVHSIFIRDINEEIYRMSIPGKEKDLFITGNHEIFSVKRKNIVCKYQMKRKNQSRCVKIFNSKKCHTSPTCFDRREINIESKKTRVDNLSKGDYITSPIIQSTGINIDIKNIKFARLLGYYLAEGYGSKYHIDLTFNTKEKETYVKEVKDIVKELFNLNGTIKIKENTARIFFYSKDFSSFLKKYIPGNAVDKQIHIDILNMDKNWLYNFVGAYCNGDGCYTKETEISFCTASKKLIYQMKLLLNRININTSKAFHSIIFLNGKNFHKYSICVPIGQCVKLSKYCDREDFIGFKHSSKSRSFFSEKEQFSYIKEIKKLDYEGEVYCLGVEDDESFVANGVSISNCRFFAQNDPTIASSLRFYAQFPFHGYENVINDPIRKEFFDDLKKRLEIDRWLPLIAYEYFAIGDVFPFISVSCPKCQGFGVFEGEPCDHEGGHVGGLSILNPDWMEVKLDILFGGKSFISLIPDETLKQICVSKKPPEIYNRIPQHLRQLVVTAQPIPLNNNSVTHMKHDEIPYMAYGRSLIASLFPTLAYQDKLRQAQWIVADRHILPIKVAKVGSDTRPAGPADIADTRRQLAVTANDPNLTLVTHHNFNYEWVGSSGKILQLTKEYELVEKAIVNGMGVNDALLSGSGPSYCIPQYSRILTNNGFKNLDEFNQKKHLVATLNPNTHKFEWGKATYTHVFDHNSIDGDDNPLIHFNTKNKIDCIVTENHEMYVKQKLGRKISDKYEKIRADKVKNRSKFILKTKGWEGSIPHNVDALTNGIELDTFLQMSAYFVTEGSYLKYYPKKKMEDGTLSYCHENYNSICVINKRTITKRKKVGISFTQGVESNIINDFIGLKEKIKPYGLNLYNTLYKESFRGNIKRKACYRFSINNIPLAEKFNKYFSEYSYDKTIPKWIKNLPQEYLEKFIYHCVKGDGHERDLKYNKTIFSYTTTSIKLNEDIFEILIKIGKSPRISITDYTNENKNYKNNERKRKHDQYTLYWSDTNHGDYPTIVSQRGNNAFKKMDYKGKVWCVTVPPNNLILVENNGRAIWTGNSQAAIGIEATIKRLRTVQNMLSSWICDKIYKMEAKMQGFYKKNLQGKNVLDYPSIRWNDLNLRDETQKNQMFVQLWDKGVVSTQFLCEKLDIDYDTETERVRLESAFQQQMGIAPQERKSTQGLGSGYSGGGAGGIGGAGGGIGGRIGGDENKGNLPGGNSGPGLPGDSIAPSMSGGGASPGVPSGGAPMAAYETELKSYNEDLDNFQKAHEFAPSVTRRKRLKRPKQPISPRVEKMLGQEIEEPQEMYQGPRTGVFRLSNLEQILYAKVQESQKSGNLPMEFFVQEKPEPEQMSRVEVDGFFPDVKLIIEADGKQWHSSPEDIAKNQDRDDRFRQLGWTVLRYTEEELTIEPDQVIANIIQVYKKLKQEQQQSAASLVDNFMKTSSNSEESSKYKRLAEEMEE